LQIHESSLASPHLPRQTNLSKATEVLPQMSLGKLEHIHTHYALLPYSQPLILQNMFLNKQVKICFMSDYEDQEQEFVVHLELIWLIGSGIGLMLQSNHLKDNLHARNIKPT